MTTMISMSVKPRASRDGAATESCGERMRFIEVI
jgi:hypothetical protein